eukprot:TRINITY_DN2459_c0_g1_i1.p1 TRINITY_DN2459_c0_g1~~TRINITY_DN2459_c0_g1_i1.p1  ORF type:complete len:117 (-),score=5.20 TRINITY_DN2459_c0_g1_i1:68-418(-)
MLFLCCFRCYFVGIHRCIRIFWNRLVVEFLLFFLFLNRSHQKITLANCFRQAMNFAIWSCLILQVVVQTGKTAKGELPKNLGNMYSALNIFVLEPSFMHPGLLHYCFFSDISSNPK